MKETKFKVKAFMDDFKSDGFCKLCEPMLGCIPFNYEDEIWEFELIIRKVKKLPNEDFCDVQVRLVED